MSRGGLFITFEGLEGSGKSTQARRLVNTLELAEFPVILSREPGGTPIGEAVRDILINPKFQEMDPLAETFLFAASRRQHVQEVILPQLRRGGIAVSDRFTEATLAYQGFGQQLPIGDVEAINSMCAWGAVPDITIYLDIPVEVGLKRVRERYRQNGGALDRLERLGEEFFLRVDEGYHYAIDKYGERFVVIPAEGSEDEVSECVLDAIWPRLKELYPEQCDLLHQLRG